jgi:hypothetical protein
MARTDLILTAVRRTLAVDYNDAGMKLTLTGATGFIGRRLVNRLMAERHELNILSRTPRPGHRPRYFEWNPARQDPPAAAFEGCDAVIHLAGEPLAQRWTAAAKERIRASRVEATQRLVRAIAALPDRPRTLISASAIGYYGSRGDEVLTEESARGEGFLPDVCGAWEREAEVAAEMGLRVVRVRAGVVLGHGGALEKMLPPFRAGVGGRLGSGRQWMSWVHIDDLVELFVLAVRNEAVSGPLNATAPNPLTNSEFTRLLARALHRPALVPVPALALKLMFGEMASVLLGSQRVIPAAAQRAGFEFRYPKAGAALQKIVDEQAASGPTRT